MATRTLEIQWEALVTKADPDWRRELELPFEFDEIENADLPPKRLLVRQHWRNRGAYAPYSFSFLEAEDGADLMAEDGDFIRTQS